MFNGNPTSFLDRKELEEQLDQERTAREAAESIAGVLETSVEQLESQVSSSLLFSSSGPSSLNSPRNLQVSNASHSVIANQQAEVKDGAEQQEVIKNEFSCRLKLAKAGYSHAQFDVAQMYEKGLENVVKDENKARHWYEKAEKQGHVEAQYHLGMMREYGRGGPSSDEEAYKLYERASKQGHTRAQYTLGVMQTRFNRSGRTYAAPSKWLKPASEKIDAQAQYMLGMEYYLGRVRMPGDQIDPGSPPNSNEKEACRLWQLSADQKHVGASFMLGKMYHLGLGVGKNNDRALALLKFAADAGEAQAQYYLGDIYENGLGVPKDEKQANELYEQAAKQGDVGDQFYLGQMYDEGNVSHRLTAGGNDYIKRKLNEIFLEQEKWEHSFVKSFMWYRLAAQNGRSEVATEATYRISQMYEQNKIPRWDSVMSGREGRVFVWKKRAAEMGHGLAQWSLWLSYSTGATKGVPKNEREAIKWLKRAAETERDRPKGYYRLMEAQYELGKMYENGNRLLGGKNLEEAIKWYECAAKGDERAMVRLGEMYRDGLGVEQSYEKAYELFERAKNSQTAKTQLEQLRAMISGSDKTEVSRNRLK